MRSMISSLYQYICDSRHWLRRISAVFLAISVISCYSPRKDPIDVTGDEVIAFDRAMADLVDGLNELSRKEKDFGLLVDEINVAFTLKKNSENKLGIGARITTNSTSTTKIESYSIEKYNETDESDVSEVVTPPIEPTESTGNSTSSESTATNDKSTMSGDSETKAAFNTDLANVVGGEFNATYSSVQTGEGSNLVNIKFKSVAAYPEAKIKLLARHGRLGCLAWIAETLQGKNADPDSVSALIALAQHDSRLDCGGSNDITEVDGRAEELGGGEINPK